MATYDVKPRRSVDLHAHPDPEAYAPPPPTLRAPAGKQVRSTGLPPLDARSLEKLRDNALAKARALQAAATSAARDAIPSGLAAGFAVPPTRVARQAAPGRRPGSVLAAIEKSRVAALVARAAVAAYFIHLVVEDLRAWSATRAQAAEGRAARFPLVGVTTALPAAVAVTLGVQVPLCASVLALEMLAKSSRLLWIQALLVVKHGRAPSELVAKKLTMAGAAALVAVHPVAAGLSRDGAYPRRADRAASAAGPLLASVAARTGLATSLALAVGRALVATLFFVCGAAQLRRVAARGWRPWRSVPASVAFDDGHDNNFILAEMALALPYALGWRLPAVTRGLVATLLAEACVCWGPWRPWPNPHFRAHVRSHFFVNVGAAAGLALSRSHGGGVFSVDRLARKKSH